MIGHSRGVGCAGAQGRTQTCALTLLLTVLALLWSPAPSWSQEALVTAEKGQEQPAQVKGLSAELQALVRAAEAEGATVLVIGGEAQKPATTAPTEPNLQEKMRLAAGLLRARLAAMAAAAPSYPETVDEAFERNGKAAWPLIAALLTVVALAIGYFAARLFRRWSRPYFASFFESEPTSRAEKIGYLTGTFLLRSVGVVLQIVVAVILLVIVDYGTPMAQDLQLRILLIFALWRIASYFFAALLGSDSPPHRMLRLSDSEATALKRDLSAVILLGIALAHIKEWLTGLGIGVDLSDLAFLVSSFIVALMLTIIGFRHRGGIATAMLGPPETCGLSGRILGRIWPILAGLYFLVAWAVSALRILMGFPNSTFLVSSPFLSVLTALALYGIAIMVLDWISPPKAAGPVPAEDTEEEEEDGTAEESALEEVTLRAGEAEGTKPKKVKAPPRLQTFRDLAERGIAIVIIAAALAAVCLVWGVNIFAGIGFLGTLWELVLIAFVAYLAYQAVRILIDRKVAEEGGDHHAEPGEEMGHGGRSRLATLLPLFRNFLLAVIVTMAVMIGLSQLGVNIAPLFAGAGVVGLAIGFGAQTLIKDIFSGAFFLMDDAFRVGEYIDIGSVKGTVEKISVRSMQLRHQLGTLVTVPFGEIQHLSNYSRDWVIMKLPLRLTYDTDVNKVNKLIKNLGKELLNHELIGKSFLEPLKSQGVYMMEDSAMIIRVKFMTRPGEQFQARKIIYAEIRNLFEREGIRFASREVKVRLDEHDANRPLTDEDKAKIGAAVRPILDAEEGGDGHSNDMR